MHLKVTKRAHRTGYIMSLIVITILLKPISDISLILNIRGYSLLDSLVILSVIMILVSFIHELIHASAFKLFGGKVRIGVKGLYAFTQELSGVPLTRMQFAVVLLSPLTVISAVSMLMPSWIGAIIYVLNIVGSLGDLIMTFNLAKYGSCKIISKLDGFEISTRITENRCNIF